MMIGEACPRQALQRSILDQCTYLNGIDHKGPHPAPAPTRLDGSLGIAGEEALRAPRHGQLLCAEDDKALDHLQWYIS